MYSKNFSIPFQNVITTEILMRTLCLLAILLFLINREDGKIRILSALNEVKKC